MRLWKEIPIFCNPPFPKNQGKEGSNMWRDRFLYRKGSGLNHAFNQTHNIGLFKMLRCQSLHVTEFQHVMGSPSLMKKTSASETFFACCMPRPTPLPCGSQYAFPHYSAPHRQKRCAQIRPQPSASSHRQKTGSRPSRISWLDLSRPI